MRARRGLILLVLLGCWWSAPAAAASRYSDAALIDGFVRTVFGAEYSSHRWQGRIVKKYNVPVRVHISNRARRDRRAAAAAFVRGLPRQIAHLDIRLVDDPRQANFFVHIVDRRDYAEALGREIYGYRGGTPPGRCLVRVIAGRHGIDRSDAVIVSDEGETLFRRCLVEEILQGLGPVNDSPHLPDSVFNDYSRHTGFTLFDRLILNMLYDPRIASGMNERTVRAILPAVLADLRRRIR